MLGKVSVGFLDKYLDARLASVEQTLRTEITTLHETLQREIANLQKPG